MISTVLIDNQGESGFLTEHGLSFHIQVGETKFLLDAGSSGRFAQNAKNLDIALSDLDFAVLSHGHYDHSDGFRVFFQENTKAPLYLREEAMLGYFSFSSGAPKFVGMHKSLNSSRFIFVKEDIHPLTEKIFLISHPSPHKNQKKGEEVYKVKRGWDDFIPDTFAHQQTCVIQEESQLILFNSCCHGDLEEIVVDILEKFPKYQKFSLVGGLHLLTDSQGNPRFSTDYVRNLSKSLRNLGLEGLYTGHCTSPQAFSLLKEGLGENLHRLASGKKFQLN